MQQNRDCRLGPLDCAGAWYSEEGWGRSSGSLRELPSEFNGQAVSAILRDRASVDGCTMALGGELRLGLAAKVAHKALSHRSVVNPSG